jgi:hypothetical protein
MASIAAFLDTLTTQHWLTIVAIAVGTFFGTFTALNYFAARRDRKLRTYETTPHIRATINGTRYEDRWRSVQLHVVAPTESQNFQASNWTIDYARLLRPWPSAVLARAENDDYATGLYDFRNPIRAVKGRPQGRPQRFALEFFINFREPVDDRGKKAKFKVNFSHINQRRRRTVTVWATVPSGAQ